MSHILITGGAGFIGSNAAVRFGQDHVVTIFDNLSRPGAEKNLAWVNEQVPEVHFVKGDIRDYSALRQICTEQYFDRVLHCAAQVAVTTSVADPANDFTTNAQGTLHVLEAVRQGKNPKAAFIYTSTNKVYGGLEDLEVKEGETRYEFVDLPNGVSEERCLDFHSPYGCSKGAADQYVRDYARIYGMHTVVFRQSCIYGPRQMGMEDQGWVAWFALRALNGKPVHVYGDGKQVRDVLHVDDLISGYEAAYAHIDEIAGKIYNVGGGPSAALSVVELLTMLRNRYPDFSWDYNDWRPGDQRIYVSNIKKAEREFGWRPTFSVEQGITNMLAWIDANRPFFASMLL